MNDQEYLRLAYQYATETSHDNHTQVGAIIVTNDVIVGRGSNRFPQGLCVSASRLVKPLKYKYIVHAEEIAVIDAGRDDYHKSILYCPWAACNRCARIIIESGIKHIIRHRDIMLRTPNRWLDEIAESDLMFVEAGVRVEEYDGHIGGCENLFDGELWKP